MTVKTCDRCGVIIGSVETTTNIVLSTVLIDAEKLKNWQANKEKTNDCFPYWKATHTHYIDLCRSCRLEFEKWLSEGKFYRG